MPDDRESLIRSRFATRKEHPRYIHPDWQREVACNKTRLGYWEWVESRLQQEAAEYVAKLTTVTAEDVDRLLGLGDEFLDDWAEDAVQGDKRDSDYEKRVNEWRQIRPLFAAAPKLLKSLLAIIEAGRMSEQTCALYCVEIARNAIAELTPKEPLTL